MALIGVLGEKSHEAMCSIAEILEKTGQVTEHSLINLEEEDSNYTVDVLVALENSRSTQRQITALREASFLVMNPDHKDILKQAKNNHGLLITYGFNNKDCVTASSVMENEIQVCVQRDLPTITGGVLEQQEFGVVDDMECKDPEVLLAAMTAVLLCDVNAEQLQVLNQSHGE